MSLIRVLPRGKKRKEKLHQGIQSANGLKTGAGAKKVDGTALTVTTEENAIKKTFGKRCAISFDFDFAILFILIDLKKI